MKEARIEMKRLERRLRSCKKKHSRRLIESKLGVLYQYVNEEVNNG